MNILKLIDMDYGRWDMLCNEIETSTFSHTSNWIKYNLDYSTKIVSNESFIVLDRNKTIAVVPLYVEKINNDCQISWNSGYSIGPAIATSLDYYEQEKMLKFILKYIDGIAKSFNCVKSMIRFTPLSNPQSKIKVLNYNYLLKFGYNDCSILSQVMDIRRDINKLWSEVRKGHKYDINHGKKFYQFELYTKNNITKDKFDIFMNMHIRAAGRITKPLTSFRIMQSWIENGNGILALAKYNDEYVSAVIVDLYKNQAYYNSSVQEVLLELPASVGHSLQWYIICKLKEMGIEFYELGYQQFGELPYDKPTKKELNISLFKRGFGGYTVPYFRGCKIY